MTTLELIEKHGIGVNCLSDAYDLGYQKGRADAIEEFLQTYKDWRYTEYGQIVSDDNLVTRVAKHLQMKEQKHE